MINRYRSEIGFEKMNNPQSGNYNYMNENNNHNHNNNIKGFLCW